jgi:hypothetical protein
MKISGLRYIGEAIVASHWIRAAPDGFEVSTRHAGRLGDTAEALQIPDGLAAAPKGVSLVPAADSCIASWSVDG